MSGAELLIADGNERDREGMRKLFDARGYVCTGASSIEDAVRLADKKFFPAALVDLDLGGQDKGLEALKQIRRVSQSTAVIILTRRASFEGAAGALRGGAFDVVTKTRDQIDYLTQVVGKATEQYRTAGSGDALYREIRGVLDESFKIMLEMCRHTYAHLSMAVIPLKPKVLIVDGEQDFLRDLSGAIQGKNWEIISEINGGGALDRGISTPVDIVASRDELPDLRGSMVLRTIEAQRPEVVGLLYSTDDSRIDRLDRGQVEDTERPFKGAAHLVERIDALAEELGTRAQERRFIQAFSSDHRAFLRRYAELKLKIDRLISD